MRNRTETGSYAHVGRLRSTVDGRVEEADVWLGCPGDWPRKKASLENGEAWSTVRLGLLLLAVGPFGRASGDFLDAADRVMPI